MIKYFLCRRTKTRSFDNLPSACELGSSLAPNRRSSDPSLNEKWQDHRRSLELNVAVGPEGGGNQDQEVRPNGVGPYVDGADSELDDSPQPRDSQAELGQAASVSPAEAGEEVEEAELSVAVGVAEGQIENILQEATKEEAAADAQKEGRAAGSHVIDTELEREVKVEEEEDQCAQVNGTDIQEEARANGHHPENGLPEAEEGESPPLPPLKAEELDRQTAEVTQTPVEGRAVQDSSVQEELAHGPCESGSGESEPPAAHRTITNGCVDTSPEEPGVDEDTCPDSESERDVLEAGQQLDKRASLMESSTETLTEEACSRLEPAAQPSVSPSRQPCSDGRSHPPAPCSRKEKAPETGEHGFVRTLNGGSSRPSVSAFQSVSADISREGLCNGDSSEVEPCGGAHWVKGNGERAPLSRQVSLASCNSLILHPRGSCSQHRWCYSVNRVAVSPEQPSRSHLDDDGLTLHTDAIQQRLRQIEAGHQMEVETLKKQVQELWSRLENQQHVGSHRINGDLGDEVVRR